ncbi:MAG: hypothetical protein OXQ29_20785 [Rhodospirillaceae bacterium]|nr:hypothetical protein [Rhodospirillaceae bacterium]
MAEQPAVPARKLSAEFFAIVAIGVTVLAQAAWLDGKIERLGAELRSEIREIRFEIRDVRDALGAKIEALQAGQASLDKRLAVVESHVLGLPHDFPTEGRPEPAT